MNRGARWLGDVDSNHDKQSQSLLCYRYTIELNGMQIYTHYFI